MKHLFLFTIGPVQSFIAQARKTQDLYAGSKMLSDLIGFAMKKLQKDATSTAFIFPIDPDADSKPNRFVAIVESDDIKDLGDDLKMGVENEFATGANFGGLVNKIYNCEDQFRDFLKVYWVAKKQEHYTTKPYAEQFKELEQLLGAVKNIRVFNQFAERGRKCSLNGEYNVKVYRETENEFEDKKEVIGDKKKLFHSAVEVIGYNQRTVKGVDIIPKHLQAGEGLCGISLLKRYYKQKDVDSFQATAEIATLDTLEQLKKSDVTLASNIQCLLKIDEQFIYEEAITDKAFARSNGNSTIEIAKEFQKNIAKASKDKGLKLSKYYAILAFDADSMGKKLGSAKSEAEHKKISELLGAFGQTAKKYIDENKYGRTVYAGGDDFLGFINLNHLFPVMQQLRMLFNEEVNEKLKGIDEKENAFDYSHLALTFTAGVAIAHYKTPLSEVLTWARNMEKEAKKIDGIADAKNPKNAVGIAVLKHSGEIHKTIWKWKYGELRTTHIARLLSDGLAADWLSPKFINTLTATFAKLIDTDGSINQVNNEIVKLEVIRLIKRQSKGNVQFAASLGKNLFELYEKSGAEHSASLKNFLNFLHICEFISRSLNKPLVKRFEDGEISSGMAAKRLGISRIEFFDLLSDFHISIYNDLDEETLKQDIANA